MTPDLAIDRLTAYIFKHYTTLLTEEEHALKRLHMIRFQFDPQRAILKKAEEVFHVDDLPTRFPALAKRLETSTIAAEMTRARDRVLRDNDIVLNKCPRCGELCLTPKARACVDCGHTWHHET